MKRMVKNGDLIDVEADGTITVAGKPVGGGGSDYTAGSNIEISEAKEISVKNDLTGIKRATFVNYDTGENDSCIIKGGQGKLKIQTPYVFSNYPEIDIMRRGTETGICKLFFEFDGNNDKIVTFNGIGATTSSLYVFLIRDGKVPEVPRNAGTYILKATVQSNGAVTYAWEAQ